LGGCLPDLKVGSKAEKISLEVQNIREQLDPCGGLLPAFFGVTQCILHICISLTLVVLAWDHHKYKRNNLSLIHEIKTNQLRIIQEKFYFHQKDWVFELS
jgi:hypothetical protein